MYRGNNEELSNELFNYLKEKVSIEDRDEANTVWSYFKKSNYILDLNDYLRIVTKDTIEVGYGSVESKVVVVLDTMTNKGAIEFFRYIFKKINVDFHNVYFTSINKSSDVELNVDILNKELECINPEVIITFESIAKELTTSKAEIKDIKDELFYEMLVSMDNEDSISDSQKKRLQDIKTYVWSKVKHIMVHYKALS